VVRRRRHRAGCVGVGDVRPPLKLRHPHRPLLLGCALGLASAAQAQPFTLDYLGQQIVPSGSLFAGTVVGGLSGIERLGAGSNRYLAISDDRSSLNPARFCKLSLDLSQFQRSANPGSAGDSGIRNNLAFESLTVSSDGRTAYIATENARVQDGPGSGVGTASPARIVSFEVASGVAAAQWVYEVAPVVLAPNPAGAFATNGLVELLALGEGEFIAIERSFATGAATPGVGPNGLPTGNTIRLFHVDARSATDVSGLASLAGASYTAVTKTLIADLSDFRHDDGTALALDNIEGITLGPVLADGRQSLVLVSDNNFAATQFTQFVALAVTPVPEPASLALMFSGLAAGALAQCRRAAGLKPRC
jgi:hypothetical protein